ncbi:MAG: prefoldin subunit alpha [Candidatus Aenigmarchaeota archaeon]|nr:prefoldin subunit alpha [Candidatus Aenigmarchaeota archaeon]
MFKAIKLEDKKKELEQKYFLYQFLKEQLDNMSKQAEAMQSAILETQATINALDEIDHRSSALIPLGAGTFVHGKIDDVDEIMIAIGSDIVVKENREEAGKILGQRMKEMEGSYTKLLKDMGSVTAQIQSILPEIESLAGEMNYSERPK